MPKPITAAMLVIGDEILSGRTKDRNIGHLADMLTAVGIDLCEARIVADHTDDIVDAVNALRTRYTYLFTSGGIGPTHDDITADAIAKAFGVPCDYDARAYAMLEEHYASRGMDFTDARKRMARMPAGAEHIDNPISMAPGFRIGNVHVMAGVPSIFQAMVASLLPRLTGGQPLLSQTLRIDRGEGVIAEPLAALAAEFGDLSFGSYPFIQNGAYGTNIVVRGTDAGRLDAAIARLAAMAGAE